MHDGRLSTLDDVLDHYGSGGKIAKNKDPLVANIADAQLTTRQKEKIIAFLNTLTDTSLLTNPQWSNPFE